MSSSKSINVPNHQQDQYKSFSSHLAGNGVGNSPGFPPMNPVQPQKVVAVPATGLVDSYKEPLSMGTPTSRGRLNSPNLADSRGGLRFDYNDPYHPRTQAPVTVEVDYKTTRLQQSPLSSSQRLNEGSFAGNSIDQLMFQSMKSKPSDFTGDRLRVEPIQDRATPTTQRPFFSSAPKISPASTGDMFSVRELKTQLEQFPSPMNGNKLDSTKEQGNLASAAKDTQSYSSYDKPSYLQKDLSKLPFQEQATQRHAPARPMMSYDSKAVPNSQPLSPWTPTTTQPLM